MKISALSATSAVKFKDTELGPLPEDWRVVRLGEVVVRAFGGGTPSTSNPNFWGGTIPWTTSAIIQEDDVELRNFQRRITEEGLKNSASTLAPKGSLLIGTRVGVGKSVVVSFDVAISQDLTALLLNKQTVSPYFLAYLLKERRFQSWFDSNKRGATIKGIPRQDLLRMPIPLPPLPEQRAIAHVLRTVQEAREATERVIAALRDLKKSLMRHLFTYGPVAIGAVGAQRAAPLRETEIGPIPEHWQVVRLGEVVEVRGGKRLPKGDEFSNTPTSYPYIRVVDFENGSVNRGNLKFLTSEQHNLLKRYIIKKEDVYISIAGTIGLVGLIPPDLDGAHLTENAARMILHHDTVDQRFLVFALASDRGQEQIQSRSTKTSQPKLALSRINEIPIPLPPLPEQREIARILQAVDRRIAAEEAYARALGDLFKTLLHELMTARRRLPSAVVARWSGGDVPSSLAQKGGS